ncbi:glycoside hydrolase family 2 [Bacteroides sp. An51A]|uniref:glycoside hydrolase family 2 n=1 Tax=Bacteroides sp. An51A TaxID=1965640 RepID=UPI000B37EF8E|nr:glycoside hydrolase family 2 [Bacteroides sp. An51A]OUN80694.1 glycoside hydrolase family 2 [Bacteroides sp. An51A]
MRELAHAYTEDTQVKWNGVLGRMELKAENDVKLQQVNVYPDIAGKRIKVKAVLVRTNPQTTQAEVTLQVNCAETGKSYEPQTYPAAFPHDTVCIEKEYALDEDMRLWDEFSPALYTLHASCHTRQGTDRYETTFGMREIGHTDGYLTINGNRIFLRGTLECCIFPLTGTPPTDEAGWEKVFSTAKALGLNHLRFHSYCPPEAAFKVADRMEFYLQVELPNWSLTVGKDTATNRFLYQEFDRIIAAYGNHPSFCMLSAGNELQPDFQFLNAFVGYMKRQDNRHLYATTTFTFEQGHGTQPEPEDDFFVTQWTDKGWIRGQGVFDAEEPNFNKDYRQAAEGIKVPLISHEIGQYSVYPDMKEIGNYTGTLEPLNLKAIQKDLEKKGLAGKAERYLQASGRFAVQLYKEEIERAMKTPQFSGYQLLGLQDFPGQGTALVGLVNAFWESKKLTDERYFRQFCSPVVPLARFEKATWTTNETFAAQVEIANYYKEDIRGKHILWQLTDKTGYEVGRGKLDAGTFKKGTVTSAGEIHAGLEKVRNAAQLYLKVTIEDTDWENSWSIWVYPPLKELNAGDVVLTQDISQALSALEAGKKVLLSPRPDKLEGLEGKFLPVFWSPVHFPKQAGTMGILCDPKHPALLHFPTEMHSDWQWWNLVKHSKVLVMDSLPDLQPIIEVTDNFVNNRRLASVFETKYGKGKLIMSSIDLLSTESKQKPEVKQLFYSLTQYMNSADFVPTGTVSKQDLLSFFSKQNKGVEKRTDARSIYEE